MSQIAKDEVRIGFWQRHGWKVLLGLVAIIGLFGIGDILRGLEADPAIAVAVTGMSPNELRAESMSIARLADFQVRAGGLQLLALSILWACTLLIPFRRGERWAWYAMWSFPIWALAVSVSFLIIEVQPDQPPPPPAISGWVFFGLAALLLWASGRDDPAMSTKASS